MSPAVNLAHAVAEDLNAELPTLSCSAGYRAPFDLVSKEQQLSYGLNHGQSATIEAEEKGVKILVKLVHERGTVFPQAQATIVGQKGLCSATSYFPYVGEIRKSGEKSTIWEGEEGLIQLSTTCPDTKVLTLVCKIIPPKK